MQFSGTFYYFNSIVNPLLYSLMSKRFQRAFTELRTAVMVRLRGRKTLTELRTAVMLRLQMLVLHSTQQPVVASHSNNEISAGVTFNNGWVQLAANQCNGRNNNLLRAKNVPKFIPYKYIFY